MFRRGWLDSSGLAAPQRVYTGHRVSLPQPGPDSAPETSSLEMRLNGVGMGLSYRFR